MDLCVIKKSILVLVVIVIPFLTLSCTETEQNEYRPQFSGVPVSQDMEYVFGVHPLHNPQRLHEEFSPLMEYLSVNIDNAKFKLEASRNYESYDKKLYAKKFHFAMPKPYQTINAIEKGYRVIAKMADDESFRGIVLVRKDGGISKVTDLRGKSISYPAPTALAATMMPQYFLQTHGIDVITELDNRYVGSQESSIMSVYLKQTSAAAAWLKSWRILSQQRPELQRELKVMWKTDALPGISVVALSDVDEGISHRLVDVLVNMHKHDEGRRILTAMQLSKFEPANNETYKPVKEFVKKYYREVRKQD